MCLQLTNFKTATGRCRKGAGKLCNYVSQVSMARELLEISLLTLFKVLYNQRIRLLNRTLMYNFVLPTRKTAHVPKLMLQSATGNCLTFTSFILLLETRSHSVQSIYTAQCNRKHRVMTAPPSFWWW